MATRSREIGWSEKEILLYEISKKLDKLYSLRCCLPTRDLLLESNFFYLLETGGKIVLE